MILPYWVSIMLLLQNVVNISVPSIAACIIKGFTQFYGRLTGSIICVRVRILLTLLSHTLLSKAVLNIYSEVCLSSSILSLSLSLFTVQSTFSRNKNKKMRKRVREEQEEKKERERWSIYPS